MEYNRLIVTDLVSICDIIVAADDYGFSDAVLFHCISVMLGGNITDEEIEYYSHSILKNPAYDTKDFVCVKMRLKDFQIKYCKS